MSHTERRSGCTGDDHRSGMVRDSKVICRPTCLLLLHVVECLPDTPPGYRADLGVAGRLWCLRAGSVERVGSGHRRRRWRGARWGCRPAVRWVSAMSAGAGGVVVAGGDAGCVVEFQLGHTFSGMVREH